MAGRQPSVQTGPASLDSRKSARLSGPGGGGWWPRCRLRGAQGPPAAKASEATTLGQAVPVCGSCSLCEPPGVWRCPARVSLAPALPPPQAAVTQQEVCGSRGWGHGWAAFRDLSTPQSLPGPGALTGKEAVSRLDWPRTCPHSRPPMVPLMPPRRQEGALTLGQGVPPSGQAGDCAVVSGLSPLSGARTRAGLWPPWPSWGREEGSPPRHSRSPLPASWPPLQTWEPPQALFPVSSVLTARATQPVGAGPLPPAWPQGPALLRGPGVGSKARQLGWGVGT